MRYDLLLEKALRGVVREALRVAADEGLTGNHHFYISFDIDAPGVEVPDHLRGRYPDEMTIVIQNQFWDLDVGDDGFEVTLSFNKVAERLVIPFAAITNFADPSVKFGLQFGPQAEGADDAADDAEAAPEPMDSEPGQVISLDSFRKK